MKDRYCGNKEIKEKKPFTYTFVGENNRSLLNQNSIEMKRRDCLICDKRPTIANFKTKPYPVNKYRTRSRSKQNGFSLLPHSDF